MRGLRLALLVSVACHGVALAWMAAVPDSEQPHEVTASPIEIVDQVREPEPMTVALLDDHTVVTPALPASSSDTPRLSSETRPRVETPAVAAQPPSAADPPAGPGTPRHSLMTMRRPDAPRPDTEPSAEFLGRFLANSRPLAPKDVASEQLADELATAEGNLANPRWIANATPEQLANERFKRMALADELRGRTLQPDGAGHKVERETFHIKVAPDGSARIADKPNIQRKSLLNWQFDATDAAMRKAGIDPYSSYKLQLLDETRDERVAIGKRYRKQQLARSAQHMANNLAQLWATTSALDARKRGLFELWDDCAETGTDDLVAGGRAARAYVVGFIRTKLPAGSAEAFTTDELARFNRRRKSRESFAPSE